MDYISLGTVPTDYDQPEDFKGGWRSAIYIIFVEMAERFAYYGIAGNLIQYLTEVMKLPLAKAAKTVNSWNGVSSFALFIGAFVADSFLGRFKTTLISSSIYFLGLILMTISTLSQFSHDIAQQLFFVALYITATGEGGHKPCVQTFAADQFDENSPKEKKEKSSFFNWWYFGISIGAMTAVLVVTFVEEYVSWTVGFSIPTVSVALALVVFLIGSRTYRKQRPVGSPFTQVAQVIVAAFKKRNVESVNGGQGICYDDDEFGESDAPKLARTLQFRCLDKAMIIDDEDASNKTRNPWRLCSLNQVEEVKLIFRLIPIWMCTFAFSVVVAQTHTFFIKQVSTLNLSIGPKFKLSPAFFQIIPGITLLFIVPIYDQVFVPIMRRITNIPSGINTVHRIGAGLALAMLTIVIAALVETKRVNIAIVNGLIDRPKDIVPMSVGWLIPQYLVMGLSNFFTYVGMQEIFYDQMPEDMRSMGSAFTNGSIGIGAMMSSAFISIVQDVSSRTGETWLVDNLNRAHLDQFYWVLAAFCALDLVVYVFVAKWFVWKSTRANQ